jgi:acyl-CoA thioester hydrolase
LELSVRYAETDAMRMVYYANYLIYFEVARTTALSELGHPYATMESHGFFIPVLDVACQYRKPARYGDTLRIETLRWRLGMARIRFDYQVFRNQELLMTGHSTHAFMNAEGRAIRPPQNLMGLFPPWEAMPPSDAHKGSTT